MKIETRDCPARSAGIPAGQPTKDSNKSITMLALVAAVSWMAAGCASTFKEVKPLTSELPPKDRPRTLALGELKITDAHLSGPEQKAITQAFQLGIEKWCFEHGTFDVLKGVPTTNLPPTALVLNGTITEVEKGSATARFLVGMGAGQERVQGEFALHAPDGTRLAAFVARKSYLGGTGIGGWDMMKLQDLIGQLGQLVAETTDKWIRGGKIH